MSARLTRRFFLLPLLLLALQQSGMLNELIEHWLAGDPHEHHLVLDRDGAAQLAHFHQDETPEPIMLQVGRCDSHPLLSPDSFLLPGGTNPRTRSAPDLSPAMAGPAPLRISGRLPAASLVVHERAPPVRQAPLIIPLRI